MTSFSAVAMYMLWGYLGVASLVGLLSLILLMILNGILASRVKKYQVGCGYGNERAVYIYSTSFCSFLILIPSLYVWLQCDLDRSIIHPKFRPRFNSRIPDHYTTFHVPNTPVHVLTTCPSLISSPCLYFFAIICQHVS